jgi:hypothetical protein
MPKIKLNNTTKFIIFTIVIVLITISSILTYPFLFNIPEKTIINEFNSTNSIFSSDRDSKIIDGFNGIVRDLKWKTTLTKFDIFKPKYSLLRQGSSGSYTQVWIITLNRNGLVDWKITEFSSVEVNFNLDKSIEIAKKYDLSVENPDPENITVYKQPTTEEIQAQKKVRELGENPDYIKDYKACEEKFPPATEEEYNCKLDVEKKYKAN